MSTLRKRWSFPATEGFIEVSFKLIERTRGKRKTTNLAKHGCPTLALDGLGIEDCQLVWACFDKAVDTILAAKRAQPTPQRDQAREMLEVRPPAIIRHQPSGEELLIPAQPMVDGLIVPHVSADAIQDVIPPTLIQSPVAKAKAELDSLRSFEAKRDAAMSGR